MAGEDELGDEKTEIRAESPLLPVSPAQPSQPDAEGRGRDDDQDGRDPGEIPVWRTALDVSLRRGFVSEADLMRVYSALAQDRSDGGLRTLLERVLEVYQDRQGRIEDLFITPGEKWAVIRTVNHRPKRFPFFRSSTVDTYFDLEAAKPAAVADLFVALSDLSVKSDHVLRGTDQVSFANELGYAFQNLIGQVYEAKGGPLPEDEVGVLSKQLSRLNGMWISSAKRGIPITTLEGMGIGVLCITVVASLVAGVLSSANIADLRVSTFIGVAVAGAMGAVISVLTRMSGGTFHVPVETARTNVRFLGSIRPIIGAVFAVVIVFGLIGQLLGLQTVVDDEHRFYAYFVFAFIAGFSERWAQNLLAGVAGGLNAPPPSEDKPSDHLAGEDEPNGPAGN